MVSGIGVELNEKTSAGEIAKFEMDNNVVIPQNYCAFLHFSDGMTVKIPQEIKFFGVEKEPKIRPNCVRLGTQLYSALGELPNGELVLFTNGSNKIFVYIPDSISISSDRIYKNFRTFLEGLKDILEIPEETVKELNSLE